MATVGSLGIAAFLSLFLIPHGHCSTITVQGTALLGSSAFISTFPATSGGNSHALYLSSGISIGQGAIAFPDNSLQFTGDHAASTTTLVPSQTFTNSLLSQCLNGSTVTITLTGARYMRIFYTGPVMKVPQTAATVSLGVLIDGTPVPEYAGAAVSFMDSTDNNSSMYNGFTIVTALRQASGQHNLCLQAAISAGTGGIDDSSYFGAIELR